MNETRITPGMPLIIGEAGTGHNGDLVKAFEIIDALVEAGADYAKFQYVLASEIIHPLTGNVPLPGGDIPLYEVFRNLERDPDFYAALAQYCEKRHISFLCSPFGLKSARALYTIGVSAIKIASPELNHYPLLQEINKYKLKVFLSTGVSKINDIQNAMSCFDTPPSLLHCVTSYPAPEEEYNIRAIPNMADEFQTDCGVSDHSLHPYLIPALATLHGATIIEKHITINKNGGGLDDPIALNPSDFRLMIDYLKETVSKEPDDNLKDLQKEFGIERIKTILGNGKKDLSASELTNYGRTNRSIHAMIEILPGSMLTPENTAILRTERLLNPGCSPALYPKLLGKRAVRRIPAGDGIHPEDTFN